MTLPEIHLPDHLSVSQLSRFVGCGYRWAYEHQEGKGKAHDPGWDNRLRGQCLDNAATAFFRAKAENGVGLPVAQMVELAVAEHDQYQDATNFQMPESKSRDQLAAQTRLYHEVYGQMFTPRSHDDVQRKYEYIDDDLNVPIVGIPDLVTDSGIIVDTKIKKKVPYQKVLDSDWQFTTYAMMTGLSHCAWAIITDERNPRAELMQTFRLPHQIATMKRVYNQAWAMILARHFLPAAEGYYLCTEKFCPFFGICPMGAANRVEVFDVPGLDE